MLLGVRFVSLASLGHYEMYFSDDLSSVRRQDQHCWGLLKPHTAPTRTIKILLCACFSCNVEWLWHYYEVDQMWRQGHALHDIQPSSIRSFILMIYVGEVHFTFIQQNLDSTWIKPPAWICIHLANPGKHLSEFGTFHLQLRSDTAQWVICKYHWRVT